jgi:hypothetical protein
MARYTLTITIVTDLDLLGRDEQDAIEMAILKADSAMLEVEVTGATVSRPTYIPAPPEGWKTIITDGSDAQPNPNAKPRPRRPRAAS